MRISATTARCAIASLLLGAPGLLGAQTISNLGSLTAGQKAFGYGDPGTPIYGQTFTAPGSVLTDFSFWVQNFTNGSTLQFNAYVAGWNGSGLASTPLWSSGPFSGTGSSTFVEYQFLTGGLAVASGQQYIAFVSSLDFNAANPGKLVQLAFADVPGGASLPGTFEYSNSGTLASLTNANAWSSNETDYGDLVFVAHFTAGTVTPEPATMTLLATGLVGLAATRRGRKRQPGNS